MGSEIYVRPAGVAGKFYAGDRNNLEREIALFLENSLPVHRDSNIKGLIVPHAGYMFSGGVAARAYRQLMDEDIDTVVVVAPSHVEAFDGVSVFSGNAYDIPLGRIDCDQELAENLANLDPHIFLSLKGHSESEHSLEVQLPFIHEVVKTPFKLVPIVMGEQNYQIARKLGQALFEALKGKKAIVIASSDLSHYFPDEIARKKDKLVEKAIANFDILGLAENVETKKSQMCGYGPTLAMMIYSRMAGASKAVPLLYRNSSDVTGDKSQVVGYLSAMVY